ncbi:M15 family metallopeptidase [Methylovulum psychrotolerans]|uniref:M15 family metallopeptidase n=1 Tax=Methylovulum psychrotolerans TaxID=1704499 RepID=UPI001BFFBAAA|nr:M15 family metallopeptidase [Methylovulum psychrotolerans]MBT9097492.1 M15 family metallopeptidase [Methylovulum psychrotolerans]
MNKGTVLTSAYFFGVVGDPDNLKKIAHHLTDWHVPEHLNKGHLPHKMYTSIYMVEPLTQAFTNIVERGLVDQVHSYDGSYNNRPKRGNPLTKSLHAGGAAIDLNAATNQFNKVGDMSTELIECFTDVGFHSGAFWKKPKDYMHMQLSKDLFDAQYLRIHGKLPIAA